MRWAGRRFTCSRLWNWLFCSSAFWGWGWGRGSGEQMRGLGLDPPSWHSPQAGGEGDDDRVCGNSGSRTGVRENGEDLVF